MKISTNKMVKIGMLSALSLVLMLLVRFPLIPAAPYLEYEPADVPIMIAGFMFGPLYGLVATLVVSLVQALTVSAGAGPVGFIMHVIATGAFVVTASSIYKRVHTLKGAIIGLIAGTLAMTLIMIPTNLIIQPNFYGVPYDAVVALLPTALIPFNIIKAGINSILTMLIYKSLRKVFDRIR